MPPAAPKPTRRPAAPRGISRRQSIDGIPVVNGNVTVETNDDGRLVLTVTFPRGKGILARFQPPIMRRHVKLDDLGAFVFRQIDGARSTREIINAFIERYRVNRREAELSCVEFLRSLAQRGVISVAIP